MVISDGADSCPLPETRLRQITAELLALQERREHLKTAIQAQQQKCHYLLGRGSLFSHPFLPATYLLPLTPETK